MTPIFSKDFVCYLHPLPIILCLSFLSVSAVNLGAMVNGMDVPTFIAPFTRIDIPRSLPGS